MSDRTDRLKIVSGTDTAEARERADLQKRARPFIRMWLRRVEEAMAKRVIRPVDAVLARELTNYPSANEGRCYAGRKRLACKLGRCVRTVAGALHRLRDAGLLVSKRGGPGRTSTWRFCVDGTPIMFPTTGSLKDQPDFVSDRQTIAHLDVQKSTHKPLEANPINNSLPQTPNVTASGNAHRSPNDVRGEAEQNTQNTDISFERFFAAAGRSGSEGFARAEWKKLSADDRKAIAWQIDRGGLETRGMWAGTWLRDGLWQIDPIRDARLARLAAMPEYIDLVPLSAEWKAERARLIAAGQHDPVRLMDTWARERRCWTVRRAGGPSNV